MPKTVNEIVSNSEMLELPTDAPKYPVMSNTADQLIQIGLQERIPVESLERLMALREQEINRLAKSQFVTAMADFQANCPSIIKDRTVDYATSKGRTSYKHASLGQIVKQIREPLKNAGLSYRFEINRLEQMIEVTCVITQVAGHSERTSMVGSIDDSGGKNAIQARGSTVTYLQRYTLIGTLGLVTADEDNDGDQPQAEAGAVTEDQALELDAKITDFDVDMAKFKQFFQITKLSELPANRYAEAIRMIKSPKRGNKNAGNTDAGTGTTGHKPTAG